MITIFQTAPQNKKLFGLMGVALAIMASFFALFPVFEGINRHEKAIRWTAIIGLLLAILSFSLVSIVHGIHREYRFEVTIITIA